MSIRMRSGCSLAAIATPCWPSTAITTSKPVARQASRQHVPVHLVVLDQQDLRHRAQLARRFEEQTQRGRRAGAAMSRQRRAELADRLRALAQHQDRTLGEEGTFVGGQFLGGQDHDRNVAPLAALRGARSRNSKPSISGIIRSSRIRPGGSGSSQSSAARPFSASATVQPVRLERRAQQLAAVGVVLDDQHRACRGRPVTVSQQRTQPRAVDRLGQDSRRRRAQ